MTEAFYEVVFNGGGVWWIGGGTLLDRPPPGEQGRLYLVTDPESRSWTYDTGSVWISVGASEAAAALLAKLLTVDGADSKLDADLLDGQHGSFYATVQALADFAARRDNPHAVTAAQAGAVANRAAGDALLGRLRAGYDYLNPATDDELVVKGYVDAARAGLDVKLSAKSASRNNHVLSGLQTIDGIPYSDGETCLLRAQTNPAENGKWIQHPGAWVRAPDADTNAKVTPGMFVVVEQGTTQADGTSFADSAFVLATDGPITLGTTALTFTQWPSQIVQAGAGLSKSGPTIFVANNSITKAMLQALNLGVSDFAANRGPWVRVADAAGRTGLGAVREGQLVYQADNDSYYQSNSPDGTDAALASWSTVASAGISAASESVAGITQQATAQQIIDGATGNLFATVARLKAELDRRGSVVLLDFTTTTDLLAASAVAANTWRDAFADQTFTKEKANSVIDIRVNGTINSTTASALLASSLLIDSAGAAIRRRLGGGFTTSAGGGGYNPVGSVVLPNLGVGAHTIRVQIVSNIAANAYLRSATLPNFETVNVQVIERF